MLTFTFDTNCLIDVEEGRPAAAHVNRLLKAAHSRDDVEVAMVASSASERQKGNCTLSNFNDFERRRNNAGFGHLPMLYPLLRMDIGFWDKGLWSSPETRARENLIFKTLFPSSPVEWSDYAAKKAVDADNRDSPAFRRWRNQLLDAQAYWAHEFNNRDVFVTSDRRFKVLEKSPHFPQARVLEPSETVSLI